MNNFATTILKEVYTKCHRVLGDNLCDAYLYGSYARGDNTEWSDVDILLTLNLDYLEISKYRKEIAKIISDISLDNDVTVSVALKPIELFNRYSNVLPYYMNVLKEGIKYAES